ncbi:hypothetical protein AVEN_183231-1 [Araneus ventricosus]|uniref:Uncharacterized protein n=1 Tax=Araneus ventricosus TaxID=182803 RepID=A0A4Y2S0F0_ARAVE|nr:hypothetical protein AVEN_183231-1 [Araneus ventricosus]
MNAVSIPGSEELEVLPPSCIEIVRSPLSWHRVSVRDYNTRGPRPSIQQYIRDSFQQQVIGYGDCLEWPPRSPDLNRLDFFLWGYIKQRVYATPPPTGTSKPYYGCLCQRITCYVVQ